MFRMIYWSVICDKICAYTTTLHKSHTTSLWSTVKLNTCSINEVTRLYYDIIMISIWVSEDLDYATVRVLAQIRVLITSFSNQFGLSGLQDSSVWSYFVFLWLFFNVLTHIPSYFSC